MITSFWSLLNISSKQIQWILDKALPDIVLSKQSIFLDSDNLTDTFTITTNSTGDLSVISNDDSITTVSLSGNTAAIEALTNGTCTIIVRITEDNNYLSNSMTLSVICNLSIPLANCTPEQIQEIVNSGKAAANWSVGDTTATITMNGNINNGLTLSDYQCKAILIGLDHNIIKETSGKSSAHFILGRDINNSEIAFCDNCYNTEMNSGICFNHKNSKSNSGGWQSSNLRNTALPKFKSALPSTWQNILGTVTKYSDNKGYTSTAGHYVTATSDQLFLLAEYEVFGTKTYANKEEQNSQQQYTYFVNGNGKLRYHHQTTDRPACWWLRSVTVNNINNFVLVGNNGLAFANHACYSLGVVPGFAIIQS